MVKLTYGCSWFYVMKCNALAKHIYKAKCIKIVLLNGNIYLQYLYELINIVLQKMYSMYKSNHLYFTESFIKKFEIIKTL